ncbi:MAG: hypothetical protein QW561_02780 [Candidatus Aenigmatarchaeota archaeon]
MKGISTPLLIVITLIVILITALVILTIFSGGTQDIASVINSWLHGPGGELPPACATGCNAWKATCKPGESIPYRSFPGCDFEGNCVCPQVQK